LQQLALRNANEVVHLQEIIAGTKSDGPWSIQKGKHADILIQYSIPVKLSPNTTGILQSNGNLHTSQNCSVKCMQAILSSVTNASDFTSDFKTTGPYFQTIWITLKAT
jgi:hypothetical protein